MSKKHTKATPLQRLQTLRLFSIQEAKESGVSQPTLSRLVSRGEVIKLQRGYYQCKEAALLEPEEEGYSIACKKFGENSVIGGLTALFHYQLIDQVPTQLWVLVPHQKRCSDSKYRLLRTIQDRNLCVERKAHFRIVSLDRALIDGLRFKAKIGERTAIGAIVRGLKSNVCSEQSLFSAAKELDATDLLLQYWELIRGAIE